MADDKKLSWECLETKHLIRDQWIDLCASVYRLPDGQELAPFYTYHRCDFVVIVALDAEENYILFFVKCFSLNSALKFPFFVLGIPVKKRDVMFNLVPSVS